MLSSLKQTLGRAAGGESPDLKKLRDVLISVEDRVRELSADFRALREEAQGIRELRREVQTLREELAALRGSSRFNAPQDVAPPAVAGAGVPAEVEPSEVPVEVEPSEVPAEALPDLPASEAQMIVDVLAEVALPAGSPEVRAAPPQSMTDAVQLALQGGRMLYADTGSTDLASYMARARAAGRSLDSLSGGEGLNQATDGAVFWGPVDNESSRAKAAKRVLTIDQMECIACGTCVEQTDKVFYLPDGEKATPIAQDGPMDLIQDAIDECPVTCIHWVPTEEAEARGLATGVEYLNTDA